MGGETEEQKKFKNSKHFKKVIENVNKRLGFDGQGASDGQQISWLPFKDVYTMWQLCRFQTGFWPNSRQPFCAPFFEDDLKVSSFLRRDNHNATRIYNKVKLSCNLMWSVLIHLVGIRILQGPSILSN